MRIVICERFGAGGHVAIQTNKTIKPHDVFISDGQYMYALTSDFEMSDRDVTKVTGTVPKKPEKITALNTCYCNGTITCEEAKRVAGSFPAEEAKKVIKSFPAGWIKVSPPEGIEVLARLSKICTLAVYSEGKWRDANDDEELYIDEWLNVDLRG